MKNKRNWSNSEMRSLTRGEAMHHFSKGEHYYVDKDWYIWFLGNATRYAIFHTFLWKYGNGEMVSYTDLTRTEKIGSQRLKIDSIKATIREGLTLGYIEAFKSEKDRRVTMYSFDQSWEGMGEICISPLSNNIRVRLIYKKAIIPQVQ